MQQCNNATMLPKNSVQLLKQRDKNSTQEWLNKLPQMVKQLEVSLYRSAASFEAYADKSTLKSRLQYLAMEIAKKTQGEKDGSSATNAPVTTSSGKNIGSGESVNGNGKHREGSSGGSVTGRRPDSQPSSRNSFSNHNGMSSNGNGSRPGSDSVLVPPHRASMSTPTSAPGIMRMDQPGPPALPPWHRPRSVEPGNMGMPPNGPGPVSSSNPKVVNLGQINDMMSNSNHMAPPTPSAPNSKSSEKEWEVRIRHKQQRLLLLHHSSKCQYTEKCPVTQHCADMKKLWVHMARCEDNRCQVPHCYSSRAILSHYRKCKDHECQVCGPVRESVWKHRNKTGTAPPSAPNSGSFPSGPPSLPPQQPPQQPTMPMSGVTSRDPLPKPVPGPMRPSSSSTPPPPQPSHPPQSISDPKIKHKQQRLLLLRHASKCTAKDGECRKTPHCAEMKKLWKHISECHDKNCKYPHCLSSRYVLMHYRRCKDSRCPACAPVRETIRQSTQEADKGNAAKPTKRQKTEPQNGPVIPKKEETLPVPPKSSKPSTPTPTQSSKANNEDLSYSIINNFTIEQIELHLKSLNQTYMLPQKVLKEKCMTVLKASQDHEYFWVFAKPVDPLELGLPDYFDIIKKPMDLGTVQKRLESGQYHSIEDFNCDVRLTFDNALTYNEAGSVVNGMATDMKAKYEIKYKEMLESLRKEEEERKKNEKACALCGFEKLQFEPPVFFCNNMKCSSKRIHRNRHFYVGGNNQYNYCSQCYNELDNEVPIELPDMTLKKADLKKKKNDEVHEENWVQCDVCQRWIHQICGLFNSRQNKDNRSIYSCPKCLLDERKKGKRPGKANAPTAEDLPRTKLSEWIETYIRPKIQAQHKVLAQEKSEVEVSLCTAPFSFLQYCLYCFNAYFLSRL